MSKLVKKPLAVEKCWFAGLAKNSTDLNPTEILWHVMKTKVADQHPTSIESLIIAIKIVWIQKLVL